MDNLRQADPASAEDIRHAGHSGHSLRLQRYGESIELHGPRNLAIARSTLLEVLARHAVAAGVTVRSGLQVEASTLDADIVIAADGVRSATREKLADELGARVQIGRTLYLWCGADLALTDSLFASAHTRDGLFVTHAYPYSPGHSTFLIEADEESWRAAGMDVSDASTAATASDEYSLRYLQDAFAEQLAGHRLLGNRSRWLRFYTVHLERWSSGNVIVMGDAAHTAHYTLGSGTKLAMEDAIALAQALLAEDDITSAAARYEQQRRPAVTRFQQLAARSQRWWESFPLRLERPLSTLALGFMTRAGNIDLDRLSAHGGDLVLSELREYSPQAPSTLPDDVTGWALEQPFTVAGRVLPTRVVPYPAAVGAPVTQIEWSEPDPWTAAADAVVAGTPGDCVLWLHGASDVAAVQGRLDLAERLTLQLGATLAVELPGQARAEGATALVSHRCHLLHFAD